MRHLKKSFGRCNAAFDLNKLLDAILSPALGSTLEM